MNKELCKWNKYKRENKTKTQVKQESKTSTHINTLKQTNIQQTCISIKALKENYIHTKKTEAQTQ